MPRSPRHPPMRGPFWTTVLVAAASFGAFRTWHWWLESERAPRPEAARTEFAVDGLDCPVWCAVRLEQELESLPGVEVEGVDLGARTVVVRHDARQSTAALVAALAERGFRVRGIVPTGKETRN